MGSIGTAEIVIIFILALIVFGPRKLPELGKTIGKGLAEFKKASNDLKKTWEDEVKLDKEKDTLGGVISETTGSLSEIVSDVKNSVSEIVGDVNKTIDTAVSDSVLEGSKTESLKS